MADEIDRAVVRCKVKPGSELEKLLRSNFYNVVGIAEENRDAKLDKFLNEQRSNPLYADSLVAPVCPPQERDKPPIEKIDTMNLNRETFEQIVAGRISVTK